MLYCPLKRKFVWTSHQCNIHITLTSLKNRFWHRRPWKDGEEEGGRAGAEWSESEVLCVQPAGPRVNRVTGGGRWPPGASPLPCAASPPPTPHPRPASPSLRPACMATLGRWRGMPWWPSWPGLAPMDSRGSWLVTSWILTCRHAEEAVRWRKFGGAGGGGGGGRGERGWSQIKMSSPSKCVTGLFVSLAARR